MFISGREMDEKKKTLSKPTPVMFILRMLGRQGHTCTLPGCAEVRIGFRSLE
jgi:hypothetical protein